MNLMSGVDNLRKSITDFSKLSPGAVIIERLIDAANHDVRQNIDDVYNFYDVNCVGIRPKDAEDMFAQLVGSNEVNIIQTFKVEELCQLNDGIITRDDTEIIPTDFKSTNLDVRDTRYNTPRRYRGFSFRPVQFTLRVFHFNSNETGYYSNTKVKFYDFKNNPITEDTAAKYRDSISLTSIIEEAEE